MNAAATTPDRQEKTPAVAKPAKPTRKVYKPFSDDVPFNESLVHQAVVAWLAGARRGTKAQKNRSAVRGGGAKPWRQKGTGRARAGTRSSPLWRGGGRTFAATPRSHAKKINRKMYRGAMRCLLAEVARSRRLTIARRIRPEDHRTKTALRLLGELGFDGGLIVVESYDDYREFCLGIRNLPGVEIIDLRELNPVALAGARPILITEGAFRELKERLQ